MRHFSWKKNNRLVKLKALIESGKTLSEVHEKIVSIDGVPSRGAIQRQALNLGYGVNNDLFYINPRRRKQKAEAVTMAESNKPTSEALNQWHYEMLLSMCVRDKKQNKLNEIIASLRVVGNAELADNLEYCTS
ncbi:MAG: hypothetical protein SPLUMA2_SPLUMAMAG2_00108 [uncultured Sulfurimonas sp.]|nr:MAG: hypothetical protein SPLUMA2_SPLUMAMAG2_00108 [uncultured Sulfurimonas sp.]